MLETIWFVLWGLLWAIYFVLDGYDLGIGTILPWLGRSEADRQAMYASSGPFWDGNEVWLITAGGVTFAAFPTAYAALFSGFYTALMLLLFALIVRGAAFELRSKAEGDSWKKLWDICLFLGSLLPAILFGVAFANIFMGVPLNSEGVNQGGLLDLLNPYGLAGGVLFLLLFIVHGSLWLAVRTEGNLHERAIKAAQKVWPLLALAGVIFLVLTYYYTNVFIIYLKYPVLLIVPILGVGALFLVPYFLRSSKVTPAFIFSAVCIAFLTLFGVIGIYPALLPSTLNPEWSLTIYNAASSTLTLKIMLGVAIVFVPLVIIYQSWVHKLFGGKISGTQSIS